jgi:hypothetical protein
MSFFGGSTETYIGTSIVRVIQDSQIPSALKSGSLKALIRNQDIGDNVMDELINSVASKGRRYYVYGKDKYIHGLPTGYPVTAIMGASDIENIIQTEIEMADVVMAYSFFGVLNYFHLAYKRTALDYGYNAGTQELTVLSGMHGFPVILTSISLKMSTSMLNTMSTDSLKNLEGHANITIDEGATTVGVIINFGWNEIIDNPFPIPDTIIPHTDTITVTNDLSIVGFDPAADYFHAQYVIGGVTKYFEYKKGSGTYTVLDSLFDSPSDTPGTYFPFMHIRRAGVPITTDMEGDEYLSMSTLSKRLGIDLKSLSDNINSNPDIGDVMGAVFMLGIPPTSTDPIDIKYLYEYFDNMFLGLGGTVTSDSATDIMDALLYESIIPNAIVIQDAVFKMSVSTSGLYRRIVTGTIGTVGTYTSAFGTKSIENLAYTVDGLFPHSRYKEVPYMLYRKQVTSTQYEEIQVLDIRSQYKVLGEYYTTGDTDANTNIVLVPLDLAVVSQFSLLDRERLYTRSMHIVFNSMVIVKVEWYQQPWFQFVMIVVAVYITIHTFGNGIPIADALLALVSFDLSFSGFVILLMDIVGVVFDTYAFKLFVKELGIENTMIAVFAAIITGTYKVIAADTMKAGWAAAEEMLSLVNSLMKAINSVQIDLMKDSQDALHSLYEESAKAFDLLTAITKKLDESNILSPFMLLGETSEEYFQRTVHTGNIGTLCYEMVSKYAKTMLTLPEFTGFSEEKNHAIPYA